MSQLQNLNHAQISSWIEPSANTIQNNYIDQGYCLFSFLNEGYCNSALLSSPNYLDLGGALAAFGLIFTVYQLRNPSWELILKIRSTWQRHMFWILGSIGLVLVLARVIMTQIPIGYLNYPFNIPVLYEVLAYLFFIASPVSLLIYARRAKNLFNEKTARKFYEVLISGVSRSDDKWSDAALGILLSNIDSICRSIVKDDRKSEINHVARSIVDVVLSEESVVKILTTKRLDALQHIFFVVEKYGINRSHCDIGITALVRNLFLDESSFLYKHLSRDGLALSSNIYPGIFESSKLLSNFNFFGYPTLGYSARKNSRISTEVFIQALSRAISTYLKTGQGSVSYINDGLEYLSNTFGSLCSKIRTEESRGADIRYELEEEWWTLHDIANFLRHDYPFLDYQDTFDQTTTEKEKTASVASFNSGSTINAGIAAVLYKSFEHLSQIEKTTDMHFVIHSLMDGILYQENYKEGYRDPFEKRMWEQVAKNVTQRYYPATLRVYLESLLYYLSGKEIGTGQSWIVQQAERMRRLLYVDLKPLLDAREKMVNDDLMRDVLLPQHLNYVDGKFIYTSGFGKGPRSEILPPPDGSASALEGVDTDSRDLLF